jgi:hypothetical protein
MPVVHDLDRTIDSSVHLLLHRLEASAANQGEENEGSLDDPSVAEPMSVRLLVG